MMDIEAKARELADTFADGGVSAEEAFDQALRQAQNVAWEAAAVKADDISECAQDLIDMRTRLESAPTPRDLAVKETAADIASRIRNMKHPEDS